jgi:tRNA pseudouridine38-40 synthase
MRYFIETSYKGTAYSGFQVQQNANTIQAEIEKALSVYFKEKFSLTGSSRTDTGVHALQNFFHFDTGGFSQKIEESDESGIPGSHLEQSVYHLNAILPRDIVISRIFRVADEAHCRFDAISREYQYFIYRKKNPFLEQTAFYYPYKLDIDKLNEAARVVLNESDFTSFSKKNTQVNNFICHIKKSEWIFENGMLGYHVEANRFLRGMVKGLVGTMLRVGTQKISVAQFENIIKSRDCSRADFSVPPHGLFLVKVHFDGIDF